MRRFMPRYLKPRLKSSERAWARSRYVRTVLRKMSRVDQLRYERWVYEDWKHFSDRPFMAELNVVEWNR